MLLLVLILVLAAFGLLVVALVQGSVLWAWLSVGISVAAAGALLFDWWQRQQALRAEELPLGAPRVDPPVRPQARSADVDSVTEFIPVLPQQGYGPGYGAPPAPGGSGDQFDPAGDTRFIPSGPPVQGEQTVLLPQARPPGSTEQPSGATPPGSPWTGNPSRSVANADHQAGPPAAAPGWSDDPQAGPPPADETIFQPVDGQAHRSTHQSNGAPVPDAPPEVAEPDAQASFGVGRADATVVGFAAGADPAAGGPPQGSSGDATDAAAAAAPAGPDGEPPEETPDAAASATVAELQDEVVVVDERPRFHVGECRFLPGRPVIPLPVAEALELGFSPCGWCTPVQVIAERRRATAR